MSVYRRETLSWSFAGCSVGVSQLPCGGSWSVVSPSFPAGVLPSAHHFLRVLRKRSGSGLARGGVGAEGAQPLFLGYRHECEWVGSCPTPTCGSVELGVESPALAAAAPHAPDQTLADRLDCCVLEVFEK